MDADAIAVKAAARERWRASSRHATRGRGKGAPGRGARVVVPDLPTNAGRYESGGGDGEVDAPAQPDTATTTAAGPADLRDLLARSTHLDYASAHLERVDVEAAWLKAVGGAAAPPATNPLALDAARLGRVLVGMPVSELLGVEAGLVTDEDEEGGAAAAERPAAAAGPPAADAPRPPRPPPPPPPPPPASSDLDADLDALLCGDGGPPAPPPPARPPAGDWF